MLKTKQEQKTENGGLKILQDIWMLNDLMIFEFYSRFVHLKSKIKFCNFELKMVDVYMYLFVSTKCGCVIREIDWKSKIVGFYKFVLDRCGRWLLFMSLYKM